MDKDPINTDEYWSQENPFTQAVGVCKWRRVYASMRSGQDTTELLWQWWHDWGDWRGFRFLLDALFDYKASYVWTAALEELMFPIDDFKN
ncbi:hypothetical protein BGX30_011395 [Mortierella sp. GBA39]|nr:hypothetical protein BGX30_011395 [Mortierella sp. GBA39]